MGLVQPSGSVHSTSLPVDNDFINDVSTQPSSEVLMTSKKYVRNTFANKTAVNVDRYGDVVKSITAYIEGSPINVTYYHNLDGDANNRSSDSDYTETLNYANSSYLKINNFEIKLESQLDYSFEDDNLTSDVRGAALVYPGFNPKMGDVFLYELEPGYLGLFIIDAVPERLSVRHNTIHRIQFYLKQIADDANVHDLEERTREVAYFDKQSYLIGEYSLILYDDYLLLSQANQYFDLLKQYFVDAFWNEDIYQTYIRPDESYDRYIIDFLRDIFTYQEVVNRYPRQLLQDSRNKKYKTIFNKIQNIKLSWNQITFYAFNDILQKVMRADRLCSLINKHVIALTPNSSAEQYPFPIGKKIIGLKPDELNGIEKHICAYCNTGHIQPTLFFNELENFLSWPEFEKFYYIPLALWMLLQLKVSLKEGTYKEKGDLRIMVPETIDITSANIVNGKVNLTGRTNNNIKLLGIVDNENNAYLALNNEVKYFGQDVIIDIDKILYRLELEELQDTWKLVFNFSGLRFQN